MKGSDSFEISFGSSTIFVNKFLEFGPAIAQPPHWSVTEVTCTLKSGQRTCNNSSNRTITEDALLVVVVIK